MNESGVWKNPATQAYEIVPTSVVQVTGVGTGMLRVQLALDQNMLDNKNKFSLAWSCTDILTAEPGYGAEAVDAETGCRYYAQAQTLDNGHYIVRIDCLERLWWWLELRVEMQV